MPDESGSADEPAAVAVDVINVVLDQLAECGSSRRRQERMFGRGQGSIRRRYPSKFTRVSVVHVCRAAAYILSEPCSSLRRAGGSAAVTALGFVECLHLRGAKGRLETGREFWGVDPIARLASVHVLVCAVRALLLTCITQRLVEAPFTGVRSFRRLCRAFVPSRRR